MQKVTTTTHEAIKRACTGPKQQPTGEGFILRGAPKGFRMWTNPPKGCHLDLPTNHEGRY